MSGIHVDHDTFNKYHTGGKLRLSTAYIQEAFKANGYPGYDGIVQIVKGKSDVGEHAGHKFTYRIRIHDGVFQYNTLISADIDDQIQREMEHLREYAVIAITDFVLYNQGTEEKTTFLITGYKLLSYVEELLVHQENKPRAHRGNLDEHRGYRLNRIIETDWEEAASLAGDFQENMTNPPAAKAPKRESGGELSRNQTAAPSPARKATSKTEGGVIPIGKITPYINSFKIHGMVSRKEDIRTIAAKNMKVFNFEMTDTNGDTIRFTAFNKLAESVSSTITENMSYYVSGGSVRPANKQYNNTGHEYEITLRNDSVIEAGGELLAAPKPTAEVKLMNVTAGSAVEAPRTIAGIQEMQFGRDNDKGEYVSIKAMISRISGNNALYKGCASEGCQKKVTEHDGQYRCEKCNKNSSNFKWLYMMQFELSDETGQVYVTAFGENAVKVVGKTAAEMGELKDSNPDEYDVIFERLRFIPKMWGLRCKMEVYNEEVRQKITVYSVDEVNQDKYIENLQQFIDQMEEIKDESAF